MDELNRAEIINVGSTSQVARAKSLGELSIVAEDSDKEQTLVLRIQIFIFLHGKQMHTQLVLSAYNCQCNQYKDLRVLLIRLVLIKQNA